MTEKEKVFRMFDSPDTSNHYVAWEICKGIDISIDEVIDYKLNTNNGWYFRQGLFFKGMYDNDIVYATDFLNVQIMYSLKSSKSSMFFNIYTDVRDPGIHISDSLGEFCVKYVKDKLSKDITGEELNE